MTNGSHPTKESDTKKDTADGQQASPQTPESTTRNEKDQQDQPKSS
ncbi:MAG: hypothetical protein IH991_25870 [Planctomycetes bacterium]|nr:hypothetical protein [Planctomycetota bacterium]